MKKKILVVYARYGSGHKTIAEYVANYIKEHNNYEVLTLDITDYGNFLGKISIKVMDWVLNKHAEFLFNLGYELMDHKVSTLGHNKFTKKSYDNKELRKIICDFNPDITISSHFYGSNLITYYNDLKLINSKLYTIITDYRTHEFWTKNHKKETGYIVGNEMVKEELVNRGVDAKKVYPFGLPLNINQLNNLDSEKDILKRYKLKGDKKIYLFFGGSTAGSMYYFDYFKTIAKMNIDADILFICGKNEKLRARCEEYVKNKKIKNIQVFGFSTDIFNLMKISDLVISKPGGATVTECLEMKVPMVLVPGIGGQEKYNAKFMSKKKYGIKIRGLYSFRKCIKKLENNPAIIYRMKDRMLKIDNNKSVEKINNLIKKCK